MKKIILYAVIILAVAWGMQNYTDFKALDYLKNRAQKIDFSFLDSIKNFKIPWLQKAAINPEKELNIFIRSDKFAPNFNAAKIGIKVIWHNEDLNSCTLVGEGWGGIEIKPGKTYSKTFESAGKYIYKCLGNSGMNGEIDVE